MASEREQHLSISWHDSAWIPHLNAANVLDYFSERSNPFYDRSCNNEIIKMQRLNPSQLQTMPGYEYVLHWHQEPILYIIRKQLRPPEDPSQPVPITNYYIVAGHVYQAPDLNTIINSRLINTIHNLQSSFEEAQSYSRYHPSKGYWWEFTQQDTADKADKKQKKRKEEAGSMFQRQRVDLLLGELAKKFPPKFVAPTQPDSKPAAGEEMVKQEAKTEVKQEKTTPDKSGDSTLKPPPEKKPKLVR